MTLWNSLDAIKAFAGDDVSTAIVELEGRAALSGFDDFAIHYEVAFRTDQPPLSVASGCPAASRGR
jgi:hypothetical protein